MKKQFIIINAITLLLFSLMLLPSCSDEKKEPQFSEKKEEIIIPDFKDEIYGDPAIFDSPRIQFCWEAPGDGESTIWSTKLDGSDLRRAVPLKLEAYGITHPPVRSPDNRYIIVSFPDESGIPKTLYDLKTKTAKIIANGGGVPFFQWTPDSRFIIFYLDGDLVKYSIEEDKIKKMPMIYSRGIYVLNDNKRILAIEKKGYKFYNFNGEILKSVTLINNKDEDDFIEFSHAATQDGKMLVYRNWPFTYVINTERPHKPIYKNKLRLRGRRPCFGPDGKNIYFSTGWIEKLNIQTGSVSVVLDAPGHNSISFPTIFNLKIKKKNESK